MLWGRGGREKNQEMLGGRAEAVAILKSKDLKNGWNKQCEYLGKGL